MEQLFGGTSKIKTSPSRVEEAEVEVVDKKAIKQVRKQIDAIHTLRQCVQFWVFRFFVFYI
jgi:hypothetical protein